MSPYLTTADVAERLRFTDTKYPLINAWKWIKRNNVRQSPSADDHSAAEGRCGVTQFMVADAVFILKCARVEYDSWEWWLLGCWMWPGAADVIAAVTIGGIVGVSAWALRRQQR